MQWGQATWNLILDQLIWYPFHYRQFTKFNGPAWAYRSLFCLPYGPLLLRQFVQTLSRPAFTWCTCKLAPASITTWEQMQEAFLLYSTLQKSFKRRSSIMRERQTSSTDGAISVHTARNPFLNQKPYGCAWTTSVQKWLYTSKEPMTFFCGQNYLNHLARRSPGFNIPLPGIGIKAVDQRKKFGKEMMA